MDNQIDQLAQALYLTIAVAIIVVLAALVYIAWLLLSLPLRRGLQPPQVPRDGSGRRLYERE